MLACLGAVLAAQSVARDPRVIVPLLLFCGLVLLPSAVGRWRMRRLLMSGDAQRVIATWEGSFRRVPHHDTMGPLMRATAYAAYGWLDAARGALERAVRGAAWEAAFEQRLFVETLLDTYEGAREEAVRKAVALEMLPAPKAGRWARRRILLLRHGVAAFARAFAHASRAGDARILARAAGASPLVHWAMRYAAAVIALDSGRPREVPALLAGAPTWPVTSAFQAYHDELMAHAGAAPSVGARGGPDRD
jgi:hypothetical protein